MNFAAKLAENLAIVRGRIAEAARRSGRTDRDIRLVAVTKYVGIDIVRELIAAGCLDLGESRPQELWAKSAGIAAMSAVNDESIRWHLIGHLQRNKVERTIPVVSLLHSGDSIRLLEAINQAATTLGRALPVLIEVNISGDATKHGFKSNEIEPILPALAAMQSLDVRGLMCMASREGDLDQARRDFAALRQLRDRLQSVSPPGVQLNELSMGMSADFEVAIEEGATIVRVGSALFEGMLGEST
jgi:pyridoxal phosphate enzyme (YggS family)